MKLLSMNGNYVRLLVVATLWFGVANAEQNHIGLSLQAKHFGKPYRKDSCTKEDKNCQFDVRSEFVFLS